MIKFSKQLNGTSVNVAGTKLHATPTSPVAAVKDVLDLAEKGVGLAKSSALDTPKGSTKIPVLDNTIASVDFSSISLKVPINIKFAEETNTTQQSTDFEVATTSDQNQKIFSLYTGLLESEPTILVSSDFLPVFNAGLKTKQGEAIALKEHAKLITAKTAINFLSQSKDIQNLITDNKNEIRDYIETENYFVAQLLKTTNTVLSYLDVSSYAIPESNQIDSVGSFYEILKKSGYNTSHIINYTETKLWQQSLLEMKRGLVTHTANLTSQIFSRKNIKTDEDPFTLSDVDSVPEELKKIWMNPYHTVLPSLSQLTSSVAISDSMSAFLEFEKKQYVNLSAVNSDKQSESDIGIVTQRDIFGKNNNARKLFEKATTFSNSMLDSYSQSGRDISIAANAINKEASYSSFATKQENVNTLLNKFGFSFSTSGDNFQIWDHIIGRFPRKITDFSSTPTGNGNSLVSYSQHSVKNGNDYFNILTFENNILEKSSITPGSTYYIDSTLNTIDGKSFEMSRLDSLIDMTRSSHETTQTIFDIMGYDITQNYTFQGITESYTKKNYSIDVSLESIVDRLSMVANLYKSCIDISSNQIQKLNTNALIAGFKLTNNDIVGTRLASLICKLAVYPNSSYAKNASRIKTLLFLWLMNVVIKQSNPSINNSAVIIDIKKRISSYIGSVVVKMSDADLEKAMWTARTLLVMTGNSSDISPEQSTMNSVVREKKAATSSYVQSVYNKVFSVDADKGIWKIIVELLKSAFVNNEIYVNENTAYSGLSKVAYLYNYFDLLLRVVAVQTPENIIGMYSRSRSDSLIDTGILISEVSKNQLDEYCNVNYISSNQPPKVYINKLNDAINTLSVENNITVRHVALFRKYLLDVGQQLNQFKNYLANNFESHLTKITDLYRSDVELTQNQRNALLSLSFSEEQLRLSKYIMSELDDKTSKVADSESKLKSLPIFANMASGFVDFLPLNDLEPISYSVLSPYFRSNEFLKEKANNKKILSIGIPPRLIRSIHTSSRLSTNVTKAIKQGLIRIKVFKMDRLHPDVVYLPKTFMFEMNRFPTRVVGNWNLDSFVNEEFNLLEVPTKLVVPNGDVELHKGYNNAFPNRYYNNFLKDEEKYQIYANHSISFLCEEYLRWFTDCKFDESRYVNFSQVSPDLKFIENQYTNFLNAVKNVTKTDNGSATSSSGQINATFTDNVSGQVYSIPIEKPKNNLPQNEPVSVKSYAIPLDNTIRSYFSNETFLLNPDISKRRISYLKKFDRVFNVIIDPDDFYVDESMTSSSTLLALKNIGLLQGGESTITGVKSPYRHRDTGVNDTTLEEYFVTIEPYDYVQEYEE